MTKARSTTSRRRLKKGGSGSGEAAAPPPLPSEGGIGEDGGTDSHLVTPAQRAADAAAATPSDNVEVQEVGKGAGKTFMENAHWLYPLIIPLGCLLLMFFGVLGADDLELTEEQEELFFLIRGFVKMTQKEKFILIIALVCQLIFTITRAFSSKGGGGEGDVKGNKRLSMKNAKKSLQARNLKRQAAGKKEWSMMFILWAIAAPIAMLIFICYAAFGFGDSLPERTDAWVYVRGMDVSKTDKEEFCKHLNCGWCPDTFGQSGDPTKPDPEKCKLGKAIK